MNYDGQYAKAATMIKHLAQELEDFVEDLSDGDEKSLLQNIIHEARELADDMSEELLPPDAKEIYEKLVK